MSESTRVVVSAGDSIPSIAREHGHFWRTVWEHSDNAALRAKRKNPNILFPGDEVVVPAIVIKEVARPTEKRHRFVLRGEPVKFRLQLKDGDEPRAGEPYVLDVDGKLFQGTTDGDGWLEHWVPATAKSGRLQLQNGKETYPVNIGHLDPIDEVPGVQQRLNNLGYNAGPEDGSMTDTTRAALSAFQTRNGLSTSGEIDEATRSKLASLHP